jgi:pterin-4a-carbinolamine dehydratase
MKSFQDFKTILTEEEKSDYTKFDALVRAGLANKAQIQRLHKILDKMGEERPQFNNADRMIIQNLFTKMVDLITNNKQIYTQARRAVREELEEGVVDTSDYKLGASGQKVKAHRVKVGDTAPQIGDDPEADDDYKKLKNEEVTYLEEGIDPPFVLILKRKAIRFYPEGIKNVLYYNERLNRYFSVPYSAGTPMNNPVQAEEVVQEGIKDEPHEIVHKDTGKTVSTHKNFKDAYSAYQDLSKASDHAIGHIPKKTNEDVTINHNDGTVSTLDEQTADAIDAVYENLSEDNQVKFSNLLKESKEGLNKVLEFVTKQSK